MKNNKNSKSHLLRSIFHRCSRHFTLAILTTIVLSGCGSGGGGGGSGASSQQSTSTGASLVIAQVNNTASPVIAVVTDKNGKEKFALVGTKDSSGTPISVTQALYISASGDAGTLQIGPDGLPTSLTDAAGNTVTFANFTNTTVDITVFDQAGNKVAGPITVAIDATVLAKLRAASGKLAPQVTGALLGMSTQDWIKTEVNVVGLGLGLAGCGAIAVGGTSLAGPLGLLAGAECLSTLVNAAQQIFGNAPPGTDYLNAGADAFSCAAHAAMGDLFDCLSFVVDGLGLVIPNDVTPPSVPTGLTISMVDQTKASFYWTGSTDDVAVAGYRIYRDGTQVANVPITFYRDQNVVPGTRYCYSALAYDAAGHSSGMSEQLCATIPVAPFFVGSISPASGANGISISSGVFATFNKAIDASTLNTSTFTISGPSGLVTGTVSYNTATNTAVFTPLANFVNSTTYTATITTGVKDLAGNPLASNYSWSFTTGAGFAPSAPTGINATAGNGQATISWNATVGVTYNLYMASVSGVTKSTYSELPDGMKHSGVTSPYVYTGLTNGTTYYFVVTAVNANGESNESSQVSAMPQVSGIPVKTSIAGGGEYTLAIKNDGTVWAWGNNTYGQLGDGTTTSRYTPVQVSELTGVTAVVGGGENDVANQGHSIALKNDGTIWTWGRNIEGQLGNGSFANSSIPVQVSGLTNVTAIAGGAMHTLVLKNDGTVRAWGSNTYGQLGDGAASGARVNRSTPAQVVGLTGVMAIASGGFHSVALKNDGTVWAWGENSFGMLGDGTVVTSSTAVQVSGLTGVVAIAAGWTHTVALKGDGTVWAWGSNVYGQLGDGLATSLIPVQAVGLSGVTAIAAGAIHTLALRGDGTVWTWGNNAWGQLGDGTPTQRPTPVQVISGFANVTAIAAGSFHSIALKNDGTVWAWGSNLAGTLGDGTTTIRLVPVQVIGFTGVTVPQCSDGIDNDGDGKIDLVDPGCSSAQDNSEFNISFGEF